MPLTRSIILSAMISGSALAAADDSRRCCARIEHMYRPAFTVFDEATGRSLQQYPPDRSADWLHMKLEITIPDMNALRLLGRQTLTYAPFASPVEFLVLDAVDLDISQVRVNGHPAAFTYDGEQLRVTVEPPTPPGSTADVSIDYAAFDPKPGLIWVPASAAHPDRPAQLHTLGQTNWNRFWFPSHDYPNDRLTTEMVVAVPEGYEVIGNGRLALKERGWLAIGTPQPMDIYTWVQEPGHPTYLVSLVVGKFRTVDVGDRRIPMPVHVPLGRDGDIKATYGNTMRMARLFESRFNEPYPWDRYAQTLVWNFAAGGMEHTASTTMYDYAIYVDPQARDGDLEPLIAHELAHQWFGDMITCRTWQHLWLNEGFATYSEGLWEEELGGDVSYLAYVQGWLDELGDNDEALAPEQPGMATRVFEHADDMFGMPANPYPKGALVLHALRESLGSDLFFRAVGEYVDRFRLKEVETDDLRRVLEEVSGEALEQFFDQWVYRPGLPRINATYAWQDGILRIELQQVQNINADNPAFALDIPFDIAIPAEDGSTRIRRLTIPMKQRTASVSAPLSAAPLYVAIDPRLTNPCRYTLVQPVQAWMAQLNGGSTVIARIQAARVLGGIAIEDPQLARASLTLLESVAASRTNHRSLRLAAIQSLGEKESLSALLRLAEARPDDAWVRGATVDALVTCSPRPIPNVVEQAVLMAWADRSTLVRGRAVRAVGAFGLHDHFHVVRQAAGADAQDDRLRLAAIAAARDLDTPESLAIVLGLTDLRHADRTRARAIAAAAELAHHQPSDVRKRLLSWAQERDAAPSSEALRAIGHLGVAEARPILESMLQRTRDPMRKRELREVLAVLDALPRSARADR
ncbi:MAG: M1 family metallopeptidase [Phycisphaeraceae bacterium]|nr:M1 family metallopeptidase [Phycisphaeraceae bacterium]